MTRIVLFYEKTRGETHHEAFRVYVLFLGCIYGVLLHKEIFKRGHWPIWIDHWYNCTWSYYSIDDVLSL